MERSNNLPSNIILLGQPWSVGDESSASSQMWRWLGVSYGCVMALLCAQLLGGLWAFLIGNYLTEHYLIGGSTSFAFSHEKVSIWFFLPLYPFIGNTHRYMH